MDRPTGSYTHERLIALEDNHKVLLFMLYALAFQPLLSPSLREYFLLIAHNGEKIREEAGLE